MYRRGAFAYVAEWQMAEQYAEVATVLAASVALPREWLPRRAAHYCSSPLSTARRNGGGSTAENRPDPTGERRPDVSPDLGYLRIRSGGRHRRLQAKRSFVVRREMSKVEAEVWAAFSGGVWPIPMIVRGSVGQTAAGPASVLEPSPLPSRLND